MMSEPNLVTLGLSLLLYYVEVLPLSMDNMQKVLQGDLVVETSSSFSL